MMKQRESHIRQFRYRVSLEAIVRGLVIPFVAQVRAPNIREAHFRASKESQGLRIVGCRRVR